MPRLPAFLASRDLRSDLRGVFFNALVFTGRERTLLRRLERGGLTVVLNLHKVSHEPSSFWPPLHPDALDDLVRRLRRRLTITTLGQLHEVPPSEPAAVLSFDDGYMDFVEHAAPILEAHGVRANMNVIPACVASGKPMWNVRLYDALAAASRALAAELRVPGFDERLDENSASTARFGAHLVGFLKRRPRQERDALFHTVERWMERVEVRHPTRMMSTADVRDASKRHEIGVHSYSHESMGYEDDAFFADDLDACLRFFRNELSLPLTIYAFPNGSYRPSHVALLRQRGIKHVLLVDEKIARRGSDVLPRLSIAGVNNAELRLRVLGQLARGVM